MPASSTPNAASSVLTAPHAAQALLNGVLPNHKTLAIIANDIPWRYDQLNQAAEAYAQRLANAGVEPGDIVALLAGQGAAYWIAWLAIRRAGATVLPLNLLQPLPVLQTILQHAQCKAIAAEPSVTQQLAEKIPAAALAQTLASLPPQIMIPDALPDSTPESTPKSTASTPTKLANPAVLLYTSGTTGQPKGVMLSAENLIANLAGMHDALNANGRFLVNASNTEQAPEIAPDTMLLALPLFHAFGMTIGLYALSIGMPLVLVSQWHPKMLLKAMQAHQPTLLPLVPTLFELLFKASREQSPCSSLRACISGGARLPLSLHERLSKAWKIEILEGYGLTETSPVVAVNRMGSSKPGTVGPALKNVTLGIYTENDQKAQTLVHYCPDTAQATPVGEIWIKGPSVMMGYHPLDTQAINTNDVHINAQGWLQTGDLGFIDEQGHLHISGGRKKELIIRAGENIAPVAIESALEQCPAMKTVAQLAVIGLTDEKLGEAIGACVVFNESADAPTALAALKTEAKTALPAWMQPDAWHVLPEMPLGSTGKIDKRALSQQLAPMKP
ncbi:MAG: class I adenylate-forming enzyme family protein [Vampirovibrionales bacterium]|nr:class I adenylate-forming enzyme family protein [Vampirovibrionales bacterium]